MEFTLSTGKKVTLRQKKGQHHFIERRLLSACMGEGGQNIGGMLSTLTIQTVVGITAIDGETVNIPQNLGEVFELMDRFSYEEWAELETGMLPKDTQEKLAEAAKNLQNSPGLEIE